MQELNDLLATIDSYISGDASGVPFFIILLLGTGLFFTFYLKFPQIRFFKQALKIVRGKFDKEGDEGDTSHFQALTTALSGTVGTGNIAGVALAIYLGGPAALFWMLMTAFLGMTTKFVEVTLSHKYREKAEDGSIAGGPMYYMKNRLNLKWMAAIFAFMTIVSSFGTGSLPQINSISNSVFSTFGIDQMITGGILAVLLALVIIGGIKRIAKVTEKLVPTMAIMYFIGAFAVILFNIENIIPSIISIFSSVFTGSAAAGGFLGATLSYAIDRGVNRGLFSNEAGQGSAPIAHAAARAHEPVSEGMVAILEPFIDTIIICTITGLVLLSSGAWMDKFQNDFQYTDIEILAGNYSDQTEEGRTQLFEHISGKNAIAEYSGDLNVENGMIMNDGITIIHARSVAEDVRVFRNDSPVNGTIAVTEGKPPLDVTMKGKSLIHSAPLTVEAFKRGFFGSWGEYIVTLGIILFAFSTAISWSYYGDRAMTFLWGSNSVIYYRIVYVIGFFLASFADTTIIWTLSGIAIALMTIPNLFGIVFLHKEMKETVQQYWVDFAKEHPNEPVPKS
ncbi:MAG: amino acid carrier protein [Calditrichaeota bacterium]|nr:amino acid carrier protein [Calditrichota bacterium]